MLISQSFGPFDVTTTRALGGAVTVLLVLPSADVTVTVMPFPLELAETLPPPAVTLELTDPDEEPTVAEPETPEPAEDIELFIVHPPLDEAALDELVWADELLCA